MISGISIVQLTTHAFIRLHGRCRVDPLEFGEFVSFDSFVIDVPVKYTPTQPHGVLSHSKDVRIVLGAMSLPTMPPISMGVVNKNG
jgi:hypothetical protein